MSNVKKQKKAKVAEVAEVTENKPVEIATTLVETCPKDNICPVSGLPITNRRHKYVQFFWTDHNFKKYETVAIMIPREMHGMRFVIHKHNSEDVADAAYAYTVSECMTGWFVGHGCDIKDALLDARLVLREYKPDMIASTLSAVYDKMGCANPHLVDAEKAVAYFRTMRLFRVQGLLPSQEK